MGDTADRARMESAETLAAYWRGVADDSRRRGRSGIALAADDLAETLERRADQLAARIARRGRSRELQQEAARFFAVACVIVSAAAFGVLMGALSVALAQTAWEFRPWR